MNRLGVKDASVTDGNPYKHQRFIWFQIRSTHSSACNGGAQTREAQGAVDI
jgi:hypothetical protein